MKIQSSGSYLDTSGHDGFDERADVLVLDGALAQEVHVDESRAIASEGDALILQIAFTSLEIERVERNEEWNDL